MGEYTMTETTDTNQRILVASDGSPAAQAAAAVAIQFAAALEEPIRGLYIVDEALALDTYADHSRELGGDRAILSRAELLDDLEAQGSVALEWLESGCRSAGVPVSTEILVGGVTEMLERESLKAELLALGRWGHGYAHDREHLGRKFQAIARRMQVPLLVGGDAVRPVRRLLLAYNGSDHAKGALAWVARLHSALPAEVAIVSVRDTDADRPGEWLKEAQAHLEGGDSSACWCLERNGQPAAEIVAAAGEVEADLVVMGRYGHSALIEWLTGSTVAGVLKGTALPVLLA